METISKLKWNWAGHFGEKDRQPLDNPHFVLAASGTHKEPRETKDEVEG